jgi:hypothetical protein
MKKRAWFFGDSFTESLAMSSTSEYVTNSGVVAKRWVDVVSEQLEVEPIVIARGGRSTQSIFTHVLHKLLEIEKGDWVFLTDSPPIRTEGINFKTKKISSYNNEQYQFHSDFLKDFSNEETESSHGLPINSDVLYSLVDYVYNFILPFENEWEMYWRENLLQLQKILWERDVKCVYWSRRLWPHFESIFEESNQTIEDDHWGIKGNIEFGKFILDNIKKENYIILNK